jgi:hypothetical protein
MYGSQVFIATRVAPHGGCDTLILMPEDIEKIVAMSGLTPDYVCQFLDGTRAPEANWNDQGYRKFFRAAKSCSEANVRAINPLRAYSFPEPDGPEYEARYQFARAKEKAASTHLQA